jgi:hypothetical protein
MVAARETGLVANLTIVLSYRRSCHVILLTIVPTPLQSVNGNKESFRGRAKSRQHLVPVLK